MRFYCSVKYHRLIRSDTNFTSSSSFNYSPKEARLNNNYINHIRTGTWRSLQTDSYWFQVDLGNVTTVTGIATQGGPSVRLNKPAWVKSYDVRYSNDGKSFRHYHLGGKHQLFAANTDSNTIVRNDFPSPIHARYIRVYPRSRKEEMSLRMELYGCELGKNV